MQYIRERLSLNLSFIQQTEPSSDLPNGSTNVPDTTDTPPKPPTRRGRDGAKLSEVIISPSVSTISESISQQDTIRSRSRSVDAPESTYVTPFQSPVASEKWSPHSANAEKSSTSVDSVYFKNHNQFNGFPSRYSTPIAGGYVNHSFIDAPSGSPVTNPNRHSQQAQVIHEHYWTWSCKCRRQFTNREKVLLLVIFFLLLIIGGLSAYLGFSDSGNPLSGGLLTPGVLQLRTEE